MTERQKASQAETQALNLVSSETRSPRSLRLADVEAVARHFKPVAFDRQLGGKDDTEIVDELLYDSREWLDACVSALDEPDFEAKPIYGINTGFGALAGRETLKSEYHTRVLTRNLLSSHAAGQGEALEEDTLRATILIRCHQLLQGNSGIRRDILEALIGMLNHRIFPVIPRMGSLGASGDLAPLAHLALILSAPPSAPEGEPAIEMETWSGDAWLALESIEDAQGELHLNRNFFTGEQDRWHRVPANEVMQACGGQIELGAKEGLALTNGASVSAALLALALIDAKRALRHSEVALAMSLEALRGFRDPFLPHIHRARAFKGAQKTAECVLRYVEQSNLLDPGSSTQDPVRVPPQDPYCLRCAPQVLGSVRDALGYIEKVVETEVNSAVDNPLIFTDLERDLKAVSGGNFHGAPLAHSADLLKIVMTDLASISERRVFRLVDDHPLELGDENGSDSGETEALPRFLIPSEDSTMAGLSSGLMIPQYTAASLVSACKTLAHPDSVDSIPSSANQEDHVSMSMNAGHHARQIIANVEAVVAIELLTAAQAIDIRIDREQRRSKAQGKQETRSEIAERLLGRGTAIAYAALREQVPALRHDRSPARDIDAIRYLMRRGEILDGLEQAGIRGGDES